MQIETDGVVLREQNTGENDRVITILTRTHGIVRAFAKGSRRLKSGSAAATQVFCYSRFVIFRGRDAYTVDDAEIKQMFYGLRDDLEKLTLAQYFCELALALSEEEKESGEDLRLLLNGLHYLETGKRPPALVKAAVEMRYLAQEGYLPNLIACDTCGTYESDPMIFRVKDGILQCAQCFRSDSRPSTPISRGVLAALRHTVYAPFSKLFAFQLSEAGLKELGRVTEQFVVLQLERTFRTLDFYRKIPK